MEAPFGGATHHAQRPRELPFCSVQPPRVTSSGAAISGSPELVHGGQSVANCREVPGEIQRPRVSPNVLQTVSQPCDQSVGLGWLADGLHSIRMPSKLDPLRNLDPWFRAVIDGLVHCVRAHRLRPVLCQQRPLAVGPLFQGFSIRSHAERALTLDVPGPGMPRRSTLLATSAPAGLISSAEVRSAAPRCVGPQSSLQPTTEPVVPWPVPLGQGSGPVRVPHTLGSRDEAANQLSGVPVTSPGRVGPAADPTVENGRDIGGVSQ